MRFLNNFFLPFLSLAFVSCTNNDQKPQSTNTSGEVNISIDESFKKLFQAQITTFQAIYPNAIIHETYLPESRAFMQLLNDSCKVIVMGRERTANEMNVLKKNNLFPLSTKIAEDAIAVIVNPESTIHQLSVKEVTQILSGAYNGQIQAVFDHKDGANARYMQDSLLDGRAFSKNVFALNSNMEVMNYVAKNKNALGFLSFNWMSDNDDSLTQHIQKRIKVVALSKDDQSHCFEPCQAYIQTKEYPFCRSIYMVNRQKGSGLGTGFVIFVAGEKGQLIVLKSGLVPAFPPQRIIQINTN